FEDEGTVIEIDIPDFNEVINNEFVKKLRGNLDLTQKVFGNVLGVTKKTIEKWEQGANPIKGPAARLLYLIDNDNKLVNKIYTVNIVKNLEGNLDYNFSIKQITPLVAEKTEQLYKLDELDNEFEEGFATNHFRVKGEFRCQKKSNYQLLAS
ncbi:MAG: helix-turn-helix domain-containing protein, partial [Bacillota bacterium]